MNFTPKEFEAYALRPGDVLLSEASGSAAEVGKPALWRGEIGECCFQNTVIRVRTRGPALPEFLHAHFLADARAGRFAEAGKGVGINHLGAERLSNWRIQLPPLNEQRRIVAKLEDLLARSRRAKEALDAIPPLLETLRRSILAAAFRGDLTKDWRAKHPDVEPADRLLARIRVERRKKWEEAELARLRAKGKAPTDDRWKAAYIEPELVTSEALGALPNTWVWASLEQVTDPVRGIPYGIVQTGEDSAEGVPTVRCGDIKRFSIDVAALKRVDRTIANQYQRTKLHGGEVLIAIRGTVGATAVASPDLEGGNISREVAMIPLIGRIDARLVMYALATPEAQQRLFSHVKGVAQSGINLGDLRTLPVALPPAAEQAVVSEMIAKKLAMLDRRLHDVLASSARLDALDRSTLAKAFRGELVPQDPTDEPAEALLARLRAAEPAPERPSGIRKKRNKKSAA